MDKNKKIVIAIVTGLATIGAIVVAKAVKNALDLEDEDEVESWSSSFFMPGYDEANPEV